MKPNKKVILPVALVALTLFASAFAVMQVYSNNGQGVPSAKTAASWWTVDYEPVTETWLDVPGLATTIKTSEPADLIISVTAECALVTDVKIRGTGVEETSISWAEIRIKVLVEIDDAWVEAEPGNVTFAYRYMKLKGLLWSPTQVNMTELPEQFIEIYEETRCANGFNFILKNVGSGVHNVQVQIMTDVEEGFDGAKVGAVIGKRTLVVESVRMVKD